jgi:hypothetical protein
MKLRLCKVDQRHSGKMILEAEVAEWSYVDKRRRLLRSAIIVTISQVYSTVHTCKRRSVNSGIRRHQISIVSWLHRYLVLYTISIVVKWLIAIHNLTRSRLDIYHHICNVREVQSYQDDTAIFATVAIHHQMSFLEWITILYLKRWVKET